VLGPDIALRLQALPDDHRKTILTEFAMDGDMDGMELAAQMATVDASSAVKVVVIEALQFRRSIRLIRQVLRDAPKDVWRLLAIDGYAEDIGDPEASARLRTELDAVVATEPDVARRIHLLLRSSKGDPAAAASVTELMRSESILVRGKNSGALLEEVYTTYPEAVSSAVMHGITAGFDLPFRAEQYLVNSALVDDGRIHDIVVNGLPQRSAEVAATIAGPRTIGLLIQQLETLLVDVTSRGARFSAEESREYSRLQGLIQRSRLKPFLEAWLGHATTDDPVKVGNLCDLLARHAKDMEETPLRLEEAERDALVTIFQRWVAIMVASPAATRYQLSQLAIAIGRVGSEALVEPLTQLLREELRRWRGAREERTRLRGTRRAGASSDAAMSYLLQYRNAFAAIGGTRVAGLMTELLSDIDFSFEAACVLKSEYDSKLPPPIDDASPARRTLDFSRATAKRLARLREPTRSSLEAESIFATAANLIRPDSTDREQNLAMRLATIGLTIPHGDKAELMSQLMSLRGQDRAKLNLATALVLEGETVSAQTLLEGVRSWLEAAAAQAWRVNENKWEIEQWLTLFPFSDSPGALAEALDMVASTAAPLEQMRDLLSALQYAPGEAAETILVNLPLREPKLICSHTWITAIFGRRTEAAALSFLDLVSNPAYSTFAGKIETWFVSGALAARMDENADFRDELLRRYADPSSGPAHRIIEEALAKIPTAQVVLALLRDQVSSGRAFDSLLYSAVENVVLEKRSLPEWQNAYQLHSVNASELRRELYAAIQANSPAASLAAACLTSIDMLRDKYGHPDSEPRHPDIQSGRPWPTISLTSG
jgi:hypothetical protein